MKKTSALIVAYTLFALAAPAPAIDENAGTAGLQFLRIGVGARQIAMGESACALESGANSIFWNPANLAGSALPNISISHNQWFANISEQAVAASYPVSHGVFGAGLLYLHMDELIGYDIDSNGDPVKTADFSPYDVALLLSYAREFHGLPVGLTAKLFQEKLQDDQAGGVALDAGIAKEVCPNLRAGLALQNMGQSVKFINTATPLPFNAKAGLAYSMLDRSLTLTADANRSVDNGLKGSFGAEYGLAGLAAFRAGYNGRTDAANGLTFGVGLTLADWTVDYAYVPYGKLGTTHRVSLQANFGPDAQAQRASSEKRRIAEERARLERAREALKRDLERMDGRERRLAQARAAMEELVREKGITLTQDGRERITISASKEAVAFEFDKYVISEGSYGALDKVGKLIAAMPEYRVEINGHADGVGEAAYNMQLSERRARNVKKYLVNTWKVPEGSIASKGCGDTAPAAPNDTPAGQARNRRVEIILIEPEASSTPAASLR